MIIILIVFAIAGWAVSARLKSVFKKYSQVPMSTGMTGKEVAEKMLRDNGIHDVKVISTNGHLTDHYNPKDKTINLSEQVYHTNSVAAAAVAAHETGHAVQHATAYAWLEMRSALVPAVNFSSRVLGYVYLAMLILAFTASLIEPMLLTIIVLQGIITLFSLITLPVEIDASNRAIQWLDNARITQGEEKKGAVTALRWAGSTYVVAALSSLTMLLYYILAFMGRD